MAVHWSWEDYVDFLVERKRENVEHEAIPLFVWSENENGFAMFDNLIDRSSQSTVQYPNFVRAFRISEVEQVRVSFDA